MLNKLDQVLQELPWLLEEESIWDSLIINKRKPFTYRVFCNFWYQEKSMPGEQLRICLHKFDPCYTDEAFLHPHPWPAAFFILDGKYKMQLGQSIDRFSKPTELSTMICPTSFRYEIVSPLVWHSVIPFETTYTVMINGKPWDTDLIAHKMVRTTAGKDLGKLSMDELRSHLTIFKDYLNG